MKIIEENKEGLKAIGCAALFIYSLKMTIFSFVILLFSILFLVSKQVRTNNPKKIDAYAQVNKKLNKKLVAATGKLELSKILADPFIQDDNFMVLGRKVEVFSWYENAIYVKDPNGLGLTYIDTVYSYYKQWTDSIPNSSLFNQSKKYVNKLNTQFLDEIKFADVKIGNYALNVEDINLFSDSEWINPHHHLVDSLNNNNNIQNDLYIFKGEGTYDNPKIGDLRMSYWAIELPTENCIVVGKLDLKNNRLVPYKTSEPSIIYGIYDYTPTFSTTKKLGLQGHFIAFLIMWFCVFMIISPVSLFYNIIPILKKGFLNDVLESGIIAFVIFIIFFFIKMAFL